MGNKMKKEKVLTYITELVLLIFLIINYTQKNYEFMAYTVVAIILLWIVKYIYKEYDLPFIVLSGFSGWIFLHMLGGTTIGGVFTYGRMLINIVGEPYFILRYDQFIHLYCYVVITAIIYYIIKKHVKQMDKIMLFLVVITGIGVGALNEILEFAMVVTMTNTGVGGYYNTALDLVFNAVGAILGVLLVSHYENKKIS
jgi:putative membrane protein